ncbi:MAG: hypothetical protein PF447_09290 [Spirochaetaceae bacterium]|jgi:hypothetical protein|nr:hypothetical protein [Spirochaetaceae bacterium]
MTAREKLLVERYRLGELPQHLAQEVRQYPHLQEELDKLDDSDQEILIKYPFNQVERKIRRNKVKIWSRLSMAAAALVLVLTGTFFIQQNSNSNPYGIRVKGSRDSDPQLTIYRHQGDNIQKLVDGDHAQAGDLLQIAYKEIPQESFGLIISLDGAGNQTVHFPMSGQEAQLLDSSGEVYLPWSYELDNAPDYEAFFLIISEQPFSLADITAPALLENRLPRGVDVYGLILNKRN